MGSTIKITESKAMSFKKLSFLYLVFILFLFFSSPGQYVVHYDQMKVTQEELNQRLTKKLEGFESEVETELALKKSTLLGLERLDTFRKMYQDYAQKFAVYGDKLKENQFSEKMIRKTQLADQFYQVNKDMDAAYLAFSGKSLKDEILQIASFTGQTFDAREFFLKETPNGVFETVIEHLKTIYLFNTITELFKEKLILPKYEQVMLKDAKFIQSFKRLLVLGNSFDMSIKPTDKDGKPNAKINGVEQKLTKNNRGLYELSYTPTQAGKYSVEVNVGLQRLFTGFEVLKPEFRFIMEASNFDAFVGEKMMISLDTQFFPNSRVTFESDKAEIVRTGEKLYVTPNEVGLFHISMMDGMTKIDDIVLYAHEPESIEVGLLDISAQPSSLNKAHRLESLNTFWQVVSFRMTVVTPDGKKESLNSATRFLRNDLRAAEQNAPTGSVLVFDDIKLLGKSKGLTKIGKPIVLKK
jgi:hypothetical protein